MPLQRTWTDDQLREAVASSTTYVEVMTKLGLTPRGRNHRRIQERIARLGISTDHFRLYRPFDDDELRAIVPACTSYFMVVDRLGLERTDANATRVQRRVTRLGISTAHFLRRRGNLARSARWSDDDLRAAVAASHGYAATLRALGLIPAGGNYDRLQRRIFELGIDTSHFRGKAWNRGLSQPRSSRPLQAVLVQGHATSSHKLKQRLIREGLKPDACELCGWAQRRACDGVVPLELDHVNGDKTDNRIDNLRILCPNCHALQPTHRGLNKKSRRQIECGERDSNPHG